MEQVLMVFQVLVTLALIVMVLIQRSDSDGFGLSGGSGGNILSGRATASLLTRTTAILATIFMLNALVLSVIASRGHTSSIAGAVEKEQAEKPATPVVPLAGAEKDAKKDVAPAEAPVKKKPVVTPADAEPVVEDHNE